MGSENIAVIDPKEKPNVRIGLRWDARPADEQKYYWGAFSATQAGFTRLTARLKLPFTGDADTAVQLREKMEASRQILMGDTPPHNLDLLAFYYDRHGQLIDWVAPLAGKTANENFSVLSSGDDIDGIGVMDDEDILVLLPTVPEDVQDIVFVVDSESHTFAEVKGGLCRAVDTATETDYFAHALGSDNVDGGMKTFIFAALKRRDTAWELHNVSTYADIDGDADCPLDDSIDRVIRNTYLAQ